MSQNPHSPKPVLAALILLVAISFPAGLLVIVPRTAQAGAQLQARESLRIEPTSTPALESTNSTRGTSPVIGILVLLAPLIYLAWKSRGVKEPKVTASCCAPVIDENKRPFQIHEEPQKNNQPRA